MLLFRGREGRGALAGNGGKMAVAQQKLLSSDNASSTTKHRGRERARGNTPRKDGAERLRQAADKRVGRISEKLAELLETKALSGNLDSLKVLVMLAERKKPSPEPVKKPRRPSIAHQWAAEPAWRKEQEKGGNGE